MQLKKWIIILPVLVMLHLASYAQDFQMTIKAGSLPNSVKAVVRPGQSVDGQISSTQVTFIVPVTVGLRPAVSIVNNFAAGTSYAVFESTEILSDGTYYVWEFDGTGGAAVPIVNYNAGVEYDLLEVRFDGGNNTSAQVRTAQLPNGGIGGAAPGNYNFYLALSGIDVVNQTAQFYGSVFSNDGNGYAGYSYAAVSGIALPVTFLTFTAHAKNNDAILNWMVENENTLTDYYEVERSVTGTNFSVIARVQPGNNGNAYTYTDRNISSHGAEILYYKIKQTDKDGRFVYTGTRTVKTGKDRLYVSVYPNPVVSFCKAGIYLPAATTVHCVFTDATGRTVLSESFYGTKGLNTLTTDMKMLPSGTYYLKVMTDSGSATILVNKSK